MSLVSNGLLIPLVILLMFRGQSLPEETQAQSSSAFAPQDSSSLTYVTRTASELGVRHRWTYEQWVEQLGREARALSDQPSSHLAILAGDSLSLWFPPELLPPKQIWLNQGISGETSTGLLKRLKLFDNTDPEVIFVMIGVNDLIRGIKANEVLSNYQKIIQELRWVHPETKIVVQSILPHSGASATWEGRDRLLAIPNSDIQALNQELSKIAQREGVLYLNLYPLFADRAGNLRPEFSTDGLHLNDSGYLIWSASLQLFSQMQLAE